MTFGSVIFTTFVILCVRLRKGGGALRGVKLLPSESYDTPDCLHMSPRTTYSYIWYCPQDHLWTTGLLTVSRCTHTHTLTPLENPLDVKWIDVRSPSPGYQHSTPDTYVSWRMGSGSSHETEKISVRFSILSYRYLFARVGLSAVRIGIVQVHTQAIQWDSGSKMGLSTGDQPPLPT